MSDDTKKLRDELRKAIREGRSGEVLAAVEQAKRATALPVERR